MLLWRGIGGLLGWVALAALPALGQSAVSFTSPSISAPRATSSSSIGSERHLQGTVIGSLYANSAFAHGYRHGYDNGFRAGDLDWQMGRDSRDVSSFEDYRQSRREYHQSFGSRDFFDQGYRAGFRDGYGDAMTGSDSKVRERIQAAASGLTPEALSANRRPSFDEGFAGGFASAQSLQAPKQGITAEYVEQFCRKTATGAYPLEYCSGFSHGYLLGVSK